LSLRIILKERFLRSVLIKLFDPKIK